VTKNQSVALNIFMALTMLGAICLPVLDYSKAGFVCSAIVLTICTYLVINFLSNRASRPQVHYHYSAEEQSGEQPFHPKNITQASQHEAQDAQGQKISVKKITFWN